MLIDENIPRTRLISYSTGVFENVTDIQELVTYCARVSNPDNQNSNQNSDKLIKYLVKHKHWSPFEMASVCIEVVTTRDIARQLLRHRSFSFQEFSQRYSDPTKDLAFNLREARLQDHKNRQNSIEIDNDQLQSDWKFKQKVLIRLARDTYDWAIENGIAKEQARSVLPEGNTLSKLYVNGTIRSWIHYIELRTGKETQKEHRKLAEECANTLASVFPMITNFNKGG